MTYLPALGREKKVKSRRGYRHRTRDDLMNPVTDDSLCNGDIKEKKDANHQILFSSNDSDKVLNRPPGISGAVMNVFNFSLYFAKRCLHFNRIFS